MPKIGVVLSGCGFLDGAEIHEAVCTLLAIDEARAEAVCFAPDIDLDEVDHLTQKPTGAKRNVLREAARIARGEIQDVAKADVSALDAVVFPGGFGAAKNLCDFAQRGPDCAVNPDVERLILAAHEARKPIGLICIAPATGAKALAKVGGARLTIGRDQGTASAIEEMGSRHQDCPVNDIVVDEDNLVVSTPAYMLGPGPADVNAGINKLVKKVLELCHSPVG